MLHLHKLHAGELPSYLEDEFFDGLQSRSWAGRLCKDLGLPEIPDSDSVQMLFEFKHMGNRRGGMPLKLAAVQMTFSAPKGVSVAALVYGDDRILMAHHLAVLHAIHYVEDIMVCRITTRQRTTPVPTKGVLMAMFHCYQSRSGDPQIHTHVLLFNCGKTNSEKWRAIDPRSLWEEKHFIGAIYRSYLMDRLASFGYQTRFHDDGLFDIDDVDCKVCDLFSAAAFNGAFKTEHGHYGMMVHKRVLLPPVPGSATVVVLDDGRVGFGTWGTDRNVGGVVGVGDDEIDSFRQNLDPLIDHGRTNPTGRNLWGFTLPGKGAQTERTGLCVTTSGHLLYAWGDDLSATSLAKAMTMAGCDYAMHLDMNPYHTGFIFLAVDGLAVGKYKSQLLTPAMSIPVDRYVQYAPKDFFYVMVHDPTPPALEGAAPWSPDGGAQPPPRWMPGVWKTQLDASHATDGTHAADGTVELYDVEPGRATWRVRAGAKDVPAASPLRELDGDESRRVLFALGIGIAHERRPLGLATDGRLAAPVRGAADSGVIDIGLDGQLAIARADAAPVLGAHDDLVELPLALWDGKAVPVASGPTVLRAALGTTASGRLLVARGSFASAAPLADALARAGCRRALVLDRGSHATAFFDRAGTAQSPRARYDESVLYAVGTPLRPKGFRFDASSPVAKGK